jgi:hypothetical protein
MMPISEEHSILIFDLLEGNLSEKEKVSALALINSDANLKKEYELLKNTYLQKDDAVHFPDKIGLYNIPKNNKRFYLFLKSSVAAAVVLIISGIGIYYFRSYDNKAGNDKISGILTPIKPPAVEEEKNTHKTPAIALNATIVPERKPIQTTAVAPDTSFITASQKPDNSIMSLTAISPREVRTVADITEEIEYRISFYPQQVAPATSRKKRSLYYQLFRTGRSMLANLQLPEVKIKTQKSTHRFPNINIQINTPASYATYHEN